MVALLYRAYLIMAILLGPCSAAYALKTIPVTEDNESLFSEVSATNSKDKTQVAWCYQNKKGKLIPGKIISRKNKQRWKNWKYLARIKSRRFGKVDARYRSALNWKKLFTAACKNSATPPTAPTTTPTPAANALFIRAQGSGLVVGQDATAFVSHGVNMNYVIVIDGSNNWHDANHLDNGTPLTEVIENGSNLEWYQDKHFKAVADTGFNTIRLNLAYRIFEDNANPYTYKPAGWTLLDNLIARAKKYGLKLIIDMHVSPGGAGIVACAGCGWRLWDLPENQARFVALWKALASRYKDETTIMAYDLLNEPAPTASATQWKTLAQTIVDAIREVDSNHLLIVEMPNWIFDKNDGSPLTNFDLTVLKAFQFLVDDSNVMYDYHFYHPTGYALVDPTPYTYPDASATETAIDGSSQPRTKAYLEHELKTVIKFWQDNDVPVNFGEWGAAPLSSKGGLTFLADTLEIFDKYSINWQYYYFNHQYQVDCCYADNPTTELPVQSVFTTYFSQN
ncbi:glycoside hydrolase family 5 protein [Oligoflexia bacterium]|nr:glycoside hydrolase family 5 protein [Oligoflexia bacterium]